MLIYQQKLGSCVIASSQTTSKMYDPLPGGSYGMWNPLPWLETMVWLMKAKVSSLLFAFFENNFFSLYFLISVFD